MASPGPVSPKRRGSAYSGARSQDTVRPLRDDAEGARDEFLEYRIAVGELEDREEGAQGKGL